ncbi:tRNA (guanosine(18)-2'-O)-methyltransferase TrmH [Gilvimarinus agarilyticus]|uniref:tRNA (guanosine(18)-2'-O)-methyltransferase TrmH n=1 Tax=Gilvimarinus sp. 2_MG-2023 TaxID=3062666 RepID=UPI001C089F2E|nr:tRNA (guanosine(18)-2'-O)-methyltransferase TrmH [Gilvimarinus sp. 2_MG-2023]MBU2885600.1 tRNA (guanosine(18)-2'-O)-methyltransferase TrmH [Gilvimarinus agarilyticus]MDO6570467.1 tRNA (guanosine(18)-2'-O)-methyltransferase TrmH [Gilvimarinus sp. 2_MG-2023]
MSRERFEKFKQVLRQRQPDMTVLTDKVHKAQNISAILRTAEAAGIGTLHMVKPERGHLVYHNTAGGIGRFTEQVVHENIEQGMAHLKGQGMALYAAHWSDRAIDYREADYTRPFALVMGAEKHGLSDYASREADAHVTIPIIGLVESYNVSVAAAIILQEAMQQRQKAGLYEREVNEDEHYHTTLFEWMHPKMVRYCKAHKLHYPAIDEDGDIIPPKDERYRRPFDSHEK